MLGQILEPIQISDMLAAKQRLRKEFPPSPLRGGFGGSCNDADKYGAESRTS